MLSLNMKAFLLFLVHRFFISENERGIRIKSKKAPQQYAGSLFLDLMRMSNCGSSTHLPVARQPELATHTADLMGRRR